MHALIDAAFSRSRTVLLMLIFILISGASAYLNIPKESEPDIAIPIIYVSLAHEGIAPEDAERLLIKPMEKELQSIEGIKEMKSTAGEGHASLMLTFDAGFNSKQALQDVRDRVDTAKAKLPADTEEPAVHEVNVALFPVITLSLSGSLPERSLLQIARDLKDRIEALPGVLEVDIGGDREELMEVLVDPIVMESYQIDYEELFSLISRNNRLVAAGAVDTGAGRLVLKVPGVVENLDDALKLPVKVYNGTAITLGEIATLRRTYKDPEGFVRVNGQRAITLEVSKRVGANIIETIAGIRNIVEAARPHWPENLHIGYLQDKSKDVSTMLGDLQNNVISAIVLVMIVIIAALGVRSSLLVGLAIPGSFFAGMLVLHMMGFTLNIVVLFSLILVVGMLVDGAIVVLELADRKLAQGLTPKQAFAGAAKRMLWPVTASTATTLVVFFPLLFWPGVVGEFMKYLPITVLICLLASLFMALVFIPVLGASLSQQTRTTPVAALKNPLEDVEHPLTRGYLSLLNILLRRPGLSLLAAFLALLGSYWAYSLFGRGIEFFPSVEPEFAQIHVHVRGDLSIHEKDRVLRLVEDRILNMDELRVVYARSFNQPDDNRGEDVIGVIQLEFIDWRSRHKASQIIEDIRLRTQDIPGIVLEVRKQDEGPSEGKPIQLQISARDAQSLANSVQQVRDLMDNLNGLTDIEDNRPLPGIEWQVDVLRTEAARYGADIALLGYAIQMLTNGIKVGEYRPDDAEEEVDIRIRFPFDERNLKQLDQLRVPTSRGMIPISHFVRLHPAPKTGMIQRIDAQRVITLQADVEEGLLVDNKLQELRQKIAELGLDFSSISIAFKGESEDQQETIEFLSNAFWIAVFLMTLILVTQFNSLYQTLLVLSAIVFSTAGVLLGLLITAQPFGIVMVGLGIIALAGIVVNNNIVLIDTYNHLKSQGEDSFSAALHTGALRLRPVLLTAVTTVLGLLPMVMSMNIDLLNRDISFGAPSTQWWTQLASAIAGGLSFATLLTLVLTPCLLVLGDQLAERYYQRSA